MRLLPDTNIVNYVLKAIPGVRERLEESITGGDEIMLCPPVHFEMVRYLLLKGASRVLRGYEALTARWTWSDLSRSDWEEAARIWSQCHRKGLAVSDFDVLIGTMAMRRDAVVVTHDTRHFESLGVPTVDWVPRGQES